MGGGKVGVWGGGGGGGGVRRWGIGGGLIHSTNSFLITPTLVFHQD